MKKVILTFGLFSMLVLTSFTTKQNSDTTPRIAYDTRGASIGAGKKLDATINFKTIALENVETGGGASIGAGKKLD